MESSLLETLGKPGHYTFFAPTNKAFDNLNSDLIERILNDKTVLQGKSLQIYTLKVYSYYQ